MVQAMGKLFGITRTDTNEDIWLHFVSTSSGGGEQNIIIYETPGSDGGAVLTTGRLNKTKTFDGNLYIKPTDANGAVILTPDEIMGEMTTLIQTLSDIRDQAIPIKLLLPITDNDTGDYLLKSFTYTIPQGRSNYLGFQMQFTEYRQKGVKQSAVNLVNFESSETFKQRLIDRRALDG
jgi:hypothetical protein